MKNRVTVECYVEGGWHKAAVVTINDPVSGVDSAVKIDFDERYIAQYYDEARAMLSVHYRPNPWAQSKACWPVFLVDMLPQGAGRRRILDELNLTRKDDRYHDHEVLIHGADNPPGLLRIAEAKTEEIIDHSGFSYQDVVAQNESFLDYAVEHGASIAGSSGAQGDAPKFLLTEDCDGRWHADGALPDERAAKHWLVKFPRGKSETDHKILKNEAGYYEVARWFGVDCAPEALKYDSGILFIPRFDRHVEYGVVHRYGMESFYSLADVHGFGRSCSMNQFLEAAGRHLQQKDLVEFVRRDVLSVAMLNTDNHGRNHAVINREGSIGISPLYDFTPMYLDGISRVSRWSRAYESGGFPEWGKIVELLEPYGVKPNELREQLVKWGQELKKIEQVMINQSIDEEIIERVQGRCAQKVVPALLEARQKMVSIPKSKKSVKGGGV